MQNTKINSKVFEEQKMWGEEGNEDYFTKFRSKPSDLYRSEKFFLPDVVNKVSNCLDVGCECGWFSEIMKSFNSQLQYTGIDITPRFIDIAKKKYQDCQFSVGDGTCLNFEDNSFEFVYSSGILHLTSFYKDIVKEMYRVSSKYILCDFRLTEGDDIVGEMNVNLKGQERKLRNFRISF